MDYRSAMINAAPPTRDHIDPIRAVPRWITAARPKTLEEAAFLSGAALAHLHSVVTRDAVPGPLWRARLAVMAAEACVKMSGRREDAGALRDAVNLLRPGDSPGPAGAVLHTWLRAVSRPVSPGHLSAAIDGVSAADVADRLDAPGGSAVTRAARTIAAVLDADPRAEMAALILADAALSRTLGWTRVVPCLSLGLGSREMRLRDDALRHACHRAAVAGAGIAVPLAADLSRRAERLRSAVPRLRASGAGRAVDLLLSRDAIAPVAFCGFMSDRAARRLCDRLVELGVVRELTGRDSFRLYGV